MRTRFLPVWFLAVALMGIGLWQGTHDAARAATYYVTNNNDSGDGSLRKAVADATTDGDKIHIITAGPIDVTSGVITLAKNVTISGPPLPVSAGGPAGQVIIRGDGSSRIFTVDVGASVAMDHLYIQGGQVSTAATAQGGAILNNGTLTLKWSTVAGNSAISTGGTAQGGGIYSSGSLTVENSTVNDNVASGATEAHGGGIASSGSLVVRRSTIYNNQATASAFAAGGGILADNLTITNSTVSNNFADGVTLAEGGGIYLALSGTSTNNTIVGNTIAAATMRGSGFFDDSNSVTMNNTIAAGNYSNPPGTSNAENTTSPLSGSGNHIDLSPGVAALADNGGPTLTMMPQASPPRESGDTSLAPSDPSPSNKLDQRGAMRISGQVDSGAVEFGTNITATPPHNITGFVPFVVGDADVTFSSTKFTSVSGAAGIEAIRIVGLPVNGDLTFNGQPVAVGDIIRVSELAELKYSRTNASATTDSFLWQGVDDKGGLSNVVNNTNQTTTNNPPAISSPTSGQTISAQVGQAKTIPIIATDMDGDDLTYGAANLPPGLSIAEGTGVISGTPLPAAINSASGTSYLVIGTVSDGNGGTDSVTFTIHVTEVNQVPTITGPTEIEATVAAGAGTTVTFTVSDPNKFSDLTVEILSGMPSYGFSGLPITFSGVSSGQTREVTLTFSPTLNDYLIQNIAHIQIQVKDENGATEVANLKVTPVLPENKQPKIITPIDSPLHILDGQPFLKEYTATDEDASLPLLRPNFPGTTPEELTFQMRLLDTEGPSGDGNPIAGVLPGSVGTFTRSNFEQNASIGTRLTSKFIWTPPSPGTYKLRVEVLDRYGMLTNLSWGFSFTLIVDPELPNNEPPTIGNPGTQTVAVNNPFSLDMGPLANDPDGDDLSFYALNLPDGLTIDGAGHITGTPTTAGNYPVTVSVTDNFHPQPTTVVFDINVIANGAPSLNFQTPISTPISLEPGNTFQTIFVSHDSDYPETLSYSATTSPSANTSFGSQTSTGSIASGTDVTVPFSFTAATSGVYLVTVKVQDSQGNSTSLQFTFKVGYAPDLTVTPDSYSGVVGQPLTITPSAQDADANETLTFVLTNAPTGLTFDGPSVFSNVAADTPVTPSIKWTPGVGQEGLYSFDITVTDSAGLQDTQTVQVNVAGAPGNGSPTVQNPGDQTVSAGSPLGGGSGVAITAVDPEGDTLTYTVTGLPGWATWNSITHTITGTPGVGDGGTSNVSVSITDNFNPTVTVSFKITVTGVEAPTLTSAKNLSEAVILHVGESYTNLFTSKDNDTDDSATFDVETLQGGVPVVITPTATMVDQSYDGGPPTQATSLLTWESDTPGYYQVKVTVTDGQNQKATKTFYVNVVADNAPPQVSIPGIWIASAGSFDTHNIFATDAESDPLTYTSSDLPSWVHITPSAAGAILSGTPDVGDVGLRSVTINVSDGVNPAVSVTFTIQVVASGVPTLQATPIAPANPEYAQINEGYSKIFVARDSDYPETLTFNVTVTQLNSGPAGNVGDASFVPMYESGSANTGTIRAEQFVWTPDTPGVYKVYVEVMDGQLHKTSLTFSIRVSSPPTIRINPTTLSATPGMPLSIPVVVSDSDDHETLTVSKGFNSPANLTFNGSSTFSNVAANTEKVAELVYTPQAFEANSNYTFDVRVTDSAGLTATQVVTINVGAVNERPVIVSPTSNSNQNVVLGHAVTLPVIVTDAENDTLTFSETGLAAVGLSIDSSTGIISGTVSGSGSNIVTVTVDDGYHLSPTAVTFKIVVGTTNHAPTLEPIANQTVIEGQLVHIQAIGQDEDNDTLQYTMSDHPGWLSIDAATGLISGLAPANAAGSWDITVTADDTYPNGTALQSFTLALAGPFTAQVTTGIGYETITYTVTNTTANSINPVVRGSLTGGGYLDNENAFFNANQGFIDDQWASPALQRKLDPTKNTRIITWTVGTLAPGATATLTISVPVKGSTPHGTELTNTWSVDYGTTNLTSPPVTHP